MSRPFLESSPSNGILSELNEGINDNPNDVLYGDVHYYDYYSAPWSLVSVPTPRFCSGFGLASFPSFETMSTAFAPEDLVFPFSQLVENRLHLGERNMDVDAFYGVPYAKPPVGELRFRKPKPAEPWSGTYNATTKPAACSQLDIRFIKDVTLHYQNASEDCLYMNVWRPSGTCRSAESCDGKLPVVIFIYGGGFQWGDSGLFLYDAANFVALSDVVFVSFNHRLGILGFLSVGTSDLPGNLGFWDQLLALKWVQQNIARFGGNPNDVTLAGHSAGAISAGLHAISQQSKGLFHRLIMQSATPLSLCSDILTKEPVDFSTLRENWAVTSLKRIGPLKYPTSSNVCGKSTSVPSLRRSRNKTPSIGFSRPCMETSLFPPIHFPCLRGESFT
ncbi:unnamed protein product [Ixodes hexagonus]